MQRGKRWQSRTASVEVVMGGSCKLANIACNGGSSGESGADVAKVIDSGCNGLAGRNGIVKAV